MVELVFRVLPYVHLIVGGPLGRDIGVIIDKSCLAVVWSFKYVYYCCHLVFSLSFNCVKCFGLPHIVLIGNFDLSK